MKAGNGTPNFIHSPWPVGFCPQAPPKAETRPNKQPKRSGKESCKGALRISRKDKCHRRNDEECEPAKQGEADNTHDELTQAIS